MSEFKHIITDVNHSIFYAICNGDAKLLKKNIKKIKKHHIKRWSVWVSHYIVWVTQALKQEYGIFKILINNFMFDYLSDDKREKILLDTVCYNKTRFCRLLLRKKINANVIHYLDIKNAYNIVYINPPIILAVKNSNYKLVKMLLKYNANINFVNMFNESAISCAIKYTNDEKMFRLLLKKGAYVNRANLSKKFLEIYKKYKFQLLYSLLNIKLVLPPEMMIPIFTVICQRGESR